MTTGVPEATGRLGTQSMAMGTRRSQAARTFSGRRYRSIDDPSSPAQGVAEDVERGLGQRPRSSRGSRAPSAHPGREDRRRPAPRPPEPPPPASPDPPPSAGEPQAAHVPGDERQLGEIEQRGHSGKAGERADGARQIGAKHEVPRVGDELVVLLRRASTPSRCTGSWPPSPRHDPATSTAVVERLEHARRRAVGQRDRPCRRAGTSG